MNLWIGYYIDAEGTKTDFRSDNLLAIFDFIFGLGVYEWKAGNS